MPLLPKFALVFWTDLSSSLLTRALGFRGGTMRAGTSCFGTAALVVAAGAAHGAERAELRVRPVSLPEACPDEAALRAGVVSRLGEDPFGADAPLDIVVAVEPMATELVGRILVERDGEPVGERRVAAVHRDCEALTEALAVAIAIILDPLPSPPAPLRREVEPSFTSTRVDPPAPLPARVDDAPSALSGVSYRAAAGVGLAVGSGPRPAPSFSAAVGLRHAWASIDAEGRVDLPTETEGATRVSAMLGAAGLSPCAHIGPFAGCALLSVGGVRGEGIGVDVALSAVSFFAALGARSSFEPVLHGPVHLRLTADLQAVVSRAELALNGEPVWTMPSVCGSFGVAVLVEGP